MSCLSLPSLINKRGFEATARGIVASEGRPEERRSLETTIGSEVSEKSEPRFCRNQDKGDE